MTKEEELIDRVIRAHCSSKPHLSFIQIGSNDGITGDPIHAYIREFGWHGILVEPVPYLFEKLLRTYEGFEGLSFENVAIADHSGNKDLYRIEQNDDPRNPYWYDQLGSFRREVVEKHRDMVPDFDRHLITEKIPCMTFGSLLSKYLVTELDLLHIDTEGYDYEIIKLIPFELLKPRMLLFEHAHLTASDISACIGTLNRNEYLTVMTKTDTFAYL